MLTLSNNFMMELDLIREIKKPRKVKTSFVVLNDKGLHTRPSTEIVKCASKFNAQIYLIYRAQEVNAKSLLGILMLAAEKGARIAIEATGEDAEEAISALKHLVQSRFNITY